MEAPEPHSFFGSVRAFLHGGERALLMKAFVSDIVHPRHLPFCPGVTDQAWGQSGTRIQRASGRVWVRNLNYGILQIVLWSPWHRFKDK